MEARRDKLKRYKIKHIRKGDVDMENIIKRPCAPIESLKQSLIEMKLIRAGKAPKRNLDDFLDRLEREMKNEK